MRKKLKERILKNHIKKQMAQRHCCLQNQFSSGAIPMEKEFIKQSVKIMISFEEREKDK